MSPGNDSDECRYDIATGVWSGEFLKFVFFENVQMVERDPPVVGYLETNVTIIFYCYNRKKKNKKNNRTSDNILNEWGGGGSRSQVKSAFLISESEISIEIRLLSY